MIRVGHSIGIRGRCGLFRSAHSLVAAERACGLDARFVPLRECNEDLIEGIPCTSTMDGCNVIVSHSGLSFEQIETGLPIIHVLHAQPRYKMATEITGRSGVFYASYPGLAGIENYKAFVTFYPEHVAYWKFCLPGHLIHVIDPPVDLERWAPGAGTYDFAGKRGKINLVVADPWRSTQDPFDIIHAVALFAEQQAGVKLHFYGLTCKEEGLAPAWKGILTRLEARGLLGEVCSWADDLLRVYRSADMLLTMQTSANNVMREALACGCPVVADLECAHTSWRASVNNPKAYGREIEKLCSFLRHVRVAVREESRAYAVEHFNAQNSGAQMARIIESVANGKAATLKGGIAA